MDSAWRVVAIVVAAVSIVALIVFARGPIDRGAHPTQPIAAIETVI